MYFRLDERNAILLAAASGMWILEDPKNRAFYCLDKFCDIPCTCQKSKLKVLEFLVMPSCYFFGFSFQLSIVNELNMQYNEGIYTFRKDLKRHMENVKRVISMTNELSVFKVLNFSRSCLLLSLSYQTLCCVHSGCAITHAWLLSASEKNVLSEVKQTSYAKLLDKLGSSN